MPKDREWLSVKPKASKTRKATVAKTKVTKKKASTKRKGATKKVIKKSTNKTTTAQRTGKKKTVAGSDVIELSSDDDDSDVQDTRLQAKVNGSCLRQLSDSDAPDSLWDDGDSDEEAEFEG